MGFGRYWSRHLTAATGGALLLWSFAGPSQADLVDFSSGFLNYVQKQWGPEAPPRLRVWQRLLRDHQDAALVTRPELLPLKQVNNFFNQVPYLSDLQHWGREDYWATPAEMLGSFGGDCEDYSVAKYLSLRNSGIPTEKLRITYVRALSQGVSHMVLAYYPTPDADPLILDNLIGDIRPASQRPDLVPVYGFNDDDLWMSDGKSRQGGASNVRLWRDLLEKLAKEQAM